MTLRLALGALGLALGAALASPALAQCAFDQSSPNANDVLKEPRPAVTIDFTVEFDLQEVRLRGPDNAEWPTDWVRVPEEVRRAEFRVEKPLPPGKYLIEWNGYLRRHHHADGGSIPFTVAAADGAAQEGAPAAAPPADAAPRSAKDSPYRALLGAGAPQPSR